MRRKPGRCRQRLARILNESFPDWNGIPVIWRAEDIYAAKGYYRTDRRADCCRWGASAHLASRPEQVFTVVDCWETMTECIKVGRMEQTEQAYIIAPVTDGVSGGGK